MNGADTSWIIVATALVLLMTLPGLALFYGGLVRARNVLSTFMQTYSIACLMSILWLVCGYSIAFGEGSTGLWGGFGKVFLLGISPDNLSGTLPEYLFFAFQMTFAIITPALIVGAYVECIGYAFVLALSGLWMLVCYAPLSIGFGGVVSSPQAESLVRQESLISPVELSSMKPLALPLLSSLSVWAHAKTKTSHHILRESS